MALLNTISGWHWLAFAVVLLLLPVEKARRPLVGLAIAALLLALVMAITPLWWTAQLALFTLFSLAATAIYWRYCHVKQPANATEKLRKRKSRLLGMRASLMGRIKGGRGQIQIKDALWTVTCGQDLPAGTIVEVTGYDDNTLHVCQSGPRGAG